MSNTKKLVVFDFDGTIADTFPHSAASYNTHAPAFDLPRIDPADYDKIRSLGMIKFFKQLNISPIKLIQFIRLVQNDIRNTMDRVEPFSQMPEILSQLANSYTLAIVTSNQDDIVASFLNRHNLATLFTEIRCEKNLFGKGAIIKKVVKKLGSGNQAIYVGDEVRDIEAATVADIPVISVTWGFDLELVLAAAHPLKIVHTPVELQVAITHHLG